VGSLFFKFILFSFFSTIVWAKPIALSSPLPSDSRTALLKVMKTPTILILEEFKTVCNSSGTKIDFERDQSIFDQLTDLKKRGDLLKIRALLFAAVHCADPKSISSLMEYLGVEILDTYPVMLIRTLHQEKLADLLVTHLVRAEPNEVSGINCTSSKCKDLRENAFRQKHLAIEGARLRHNEEPIRQQFLNSLDRR
jgi:hypothetical protein